MPAIDAKCPGCGGGWVRQLTWLEDEGKVALCCKGCAIFAVEGSGKWTVGGPGLLDRLRSIAGKAEVERSRDLDAMTSPITDPRWTQL